MTKVLFLCVHNSARSQMAEAFLKAEGLGRFEAESAGLEPGKLNPFVVRAMAELGIDISRNPTKSVFDLFDAKKPFQVVVTVCSKEAAERCPVFPGLSEKLHWSFPDPSGLKGGDEEIMAGVRQVRDLIRAAVRQFIESHSHAGSAKRSEGAALDSKDFLSSFKYLVEELPREKLDPDGRIVFMSDLHLMDVGSRDDLVPNRGIVQDALARWYPERAFPSSSIATSRT